MLLIFSTSILYGQEFEISVAPTINNVFNYNYPGVYTTNALAGFSTSIDYLFRKDKRISLGIGLGYHFSHIKMIPGMYASVWSPFPEKINLFSISLRSVYNMRSGFYLSLDPTLNYQHYDILEQIIDNQSGLGLSFGVGKYISIKERLFPNFNPAFLKLEPRLWTHNTFSFHQKNHSDRLTIIGLNLGLVFWTKNNTDGIGNCLQQPGQLSNQLHKSMRSKLFPLIKISVP